MSLKHFFDKLTSKPSAQEPSAFLAVPTILERKARIAKTLVIEPSVLDRMADALIEELDSRLVTDDPQPIVNDGCEIANPDFSALPSFKSDEHAILATLFEGHFYWLDTYHPGDSVKIWLSRARESSRQFPEIVDTFC